MTKGYVFMLTVISILASGCGKDNNKMDDRTLQVEDSVIYNMLDSSGNSYLELRFSTSDNNIQTLQSFYKNGTSPSGTMLYYTPLANTIKIEYKEINCASDPEPETTEYLEINANHFSDAYVSLFKNGCYGQEGGSYSTQHADYQPDQKLNAITYQYFNLQGPGTIETETRQKYQFSYDGSVMDKIDVNFSSYSNYRRDSAFISLTNEVSYPHRYHNLKEFNGIDPNDLVLNLFLQNNIYAIPLILNKKMSFGTRSDYLIEHIHFPSTTLSFRMNPLERMISFNQTSNDTDMDILYSFSDETPKRIINMAILFNNIPAIRYTFKYKD